MTLIECFECIAADVLGFPFECLQSGEVKKQNKTNKQTKKHTQKTNKQNKKTKQDSILEELMAKSSQLAL